VGASAQARANPFLAAERFLGRIGRDARSAGDLVLLRTLPDTDDLLVVDGLPWLNAPRRKTLRDWLAAGGCMLVEAVQVEQTGGVPGPETFLSTFGARLRYDDEAAGNDEVTAELKGEGFARPVKVGFDPRWYLEDSHGRAVRDATAGGEPRLLQYRVGDGLLYVVSDTQWLRNDGIGRHDHALALALLAADRGTVWLLHDVATPGLAVLLWRAAPAAIVSSALLLVTLLWSLSARLGPLLPPPDAGRRDLLEHLQAAGELVWRLGRGRLLVQQTRQRVERRWLQRHPPLRALDEGGRARRIAELSGLSPSTVRAALYDPVGDATRLVVLTATLQRLARPRAPHARGRRAYGSPALTPAKAPR
jgi:hypothetical protein